MVTFRTAIVLLLSATMVACSTPADLRAKTPIYTGQSNKDAAGLAGCIADDLEAQKMRNVQARPTTNGYTVTRVDQTIYGPDTPILIDILKMPQSNRIEAFSALPFAAGDRMIISAIKKCE